MKKRAVFLDRDGTLNEEAEYPSDISQIHIFPAAFEAVRLIRDAGFVPVVVTNQSAIGRGRLTEEKLQEIHRHIRAAFAVKDSALDAFYYCPHHEEAVISAYRKKCECRKPSPGMAFRAAADMDLDLGRSYMIGDSVEDIEFGLNIRAVSILVLTGYGRDSLAALREKGVEPACVAADLLKAVEWIMKKERIPLPAGTGD